MYKPEELLEADERKRKEKGINIEVPQKKKRVSDEETMEFIKTLKIRQCSIVDKLKYYPPHSLYSRCYYHRKGIDRPYRKL